MKAKADSKYDLSKEEIDLTIGALRDAIRYHDATSIEMRNAEDYDAAGYKRERDMIKKYAKVVAKLSVMCSE